MSQFDADAYVSSLIEEDKRTGVCLALESHRGAISKRTLARACHYLAQDVTTYPLIADFVDDVSSEFPAVGACLKAFLLLQDMTPAETNSRCTEALAVLEEALSSSPENAILGYNIAYVHARMRHKKEAFDFAKRVLEWKSPPAAALLLLVKIMRANIQTAEALEMARACSAILGSLDRDVLIEGLYSAAEKEDSKASREMFDLLNQNFPTDPKVLHAFVMVNLMKNDRVSAEECLERWADIDKQSPEWLFCYSQLCIMSDNLNDALNSLSAACELSPMNGRYQAALATLLFKAESKDRAVERARAAVMYDPECVHAHLALANVSQDSNEAKEALKVAMDLRSNGVELMGMGIVLMKPE